MLFDADGYPRLDLADIEPYCWHVGDKPIRRITYERGSVKIEWSTDETTVLVKEN